MLLYFIFQKSVNCVYKTLQSCLVLNIVTHKTALLFQGYNALFLQNGEVFRYGRLVLFKVTGNMVNASGLFYFHKVFADCQAQRVGKRLDNLHLKLKYRKFTHSIYSLMPNSPNVNLMAIMRRMTT